MKFGFPGGPRLEWYDRNPLLALLEYTAYGVAPHASTNRASYTVPSGKKALVVAAGLEFRRRTAATAAGQIYVEVSSSVALVLKKTTQTNTVDNGESHAVGLSGLAKTGDVLSLITGDGSTGGTVDYCTYLTRCEFDA